MVCAALATITSTGPWRKWPRRTSLQLYAVISDSRAMRLGMTRVEPVC